MTDDVAVVTGAASGIGAALAAQLRSRVHRLVLADIDGDGLASVAQRLDAEAAVVDVADATAMDELAERSGAPRYLCLNAGIVGSHLGAPWEAPPDEWARVLGVNLGGVVNGLRAFVPAMRARDGRSSILVTGSLAGLVAFPAGGPYAATKHAVTAVVEQAALALDGTGVGVTLLCPALVRTGMSDEGEDPADVARAALAAVDAERFAVAPEVWSNAITARAARLVSGDRPELPSP